LPAQDSVVHFFSERHRVGTTRRTQDLEDIKALIAANRQALKMDEVPEYFQLFNREALLEEILK